MTVFEAIVLGLIQGLTEFIPISSSGHLVIAQTFMHGASQHLFLEWINIGTVLALVLFFRQRIVDLAKGVVGSKDYRLAVNIAIAILPAGLAGFLLADFIEKTAFFGNIWTVVVTLSVVGILLVVLEKIPKLSEVTSADELPKSRALSIGLIQIIALIPGVSRSGSTIVAGRLFGLSRAHSAEFSFLISIPIMLGVIVKLLIKSSDRAYFVDNLVPLLVGNIVAFVAGLVAVGFLMKFLEKRSLAVFGWYRIGLAVVIAMALLIQ